MAKVFSFVFVLFAWLVAGPQSMMSQPAALQPYPLKVDEGLTRGGIDITNVNLVRSIFLSEPDSLPRHIVAYAAVYLAQLGDLTIVDTLKRRFRRELLLSGGTGLQQLFAEPYSYLYALNTLKVPEVRPYANEFLDTLLLRRNHGNGALFLGNGSATLRLLVALGDRSRYDVFELVMDEELALGVGTDFPMLVAFAAEPSLRLTVYQRLKAILASENDDYRYRAVLELAEHFRDFGETQSLLRNLANSDQSKKVWSVCVLSLINDYSDPYALAACQRIAVAANDTGSFVRALSYAELFPSTLALVTLHNIEASLPLGYFKDFIADDIRHYKPPSQSKPVMQILDSLKSQLQQVAALGWLADQVFEAELDGDLQRAHQTLASGDSVGCARAVKTFQDEIDFIYRDHQNPDPRDVTIDGWKYLYYNAQYILDRLPQIPPSPLVRSLNPPAAYAGGTGFSLTVKGKTFVPASNVLWNGSSRTTGFVSDSVLQATILASDIASLGIAKVAIVNPGNDTSNVLTFTITQPPSGLNVKLVNSSGTNLTGGSLQYYDGSWKDAINNNDGTFNVNTTLATVSLRMTYEGGSQTKSNVAVGPDVIVFQTVNAQVKLQNSAGVAIDTGAVQYYYSSWQTLGHTMNGVAKKELLPANYTFRMTYATATNDKPQDIGTNPTVVFSTVNATVQLKNSQGNFIDQGTVQYYFSSWQNLGTTSNGVATKELLPGNYTFRMSYASATNDKQQNIGSNPTVVFQTVNAAVQLQNSQGALIDTGTVQYYFSSWQAFGHTVNGVATAELLPANYTFRMSYASASKDKQQNVGTNPTVVFNTVNATVQLKNSLGAFIDQGTVQYYFSSWKTLGSTTNGVAVKELLPGSYTFRMAYETVTNDKVQDISTNSTVSFSTVLCTVTVKNGQGQPVDGAQVSYYFSSWRTIGATVGGQVTKELLPASLTFRETIGSATQNKVQNVGTNALVEFTAQ